ncbi:MAG: glycosyltransferase [Rhodospirillales bacterium]|nr:glycosyltransferase [Rhodospirillales bacterium]
MLLTENNAKWLEDFIEKYGHKPRVLLIGNIANNAYNNAKILNQAGLDCDVICYDYYHVMACPEWEDADLDGTPGNDFRPDWVKVSMGEYQRPKWFAQGPVEHCLKYLISRRKNASDQQHLWRMLLIYSFVSRPRNIREFLTRQYLSFKPYSRPLRIVIREMLKRLLSKCGAVLPKKMRADLRRWCNKLNLTEQKYSLQTELSKRSDCLIEVFTQEFPSRVDVLTEYDIRSQCFNSSLWEELFGFYDIIMGFATDPFRPLLAGKPYFAFEHGTLREIPFESDGRARRTALAYRLAQHCFVTNFDCVRNAEFLAPGRNTYINHPYDEDHGIKVSGDQELRLYLQKRLGCEFLFFHPTRQDWIDDTGYADKRNDVFLHAFAALKAKGLRVGLIACRWGQNVSQSQALLRELGCEDAVLWVQPMAITPFERMSRACDVVVDQFKLGAFGGVVFKAMAVGTPIVTYLNEDLVLQQYPEIPPVLNCKSTDDIILSVENIIENPDYLRILGGLSREWIKCYHGKFETINKQIDQFRLHS